MAQVVKKRVASVDKGRHLHVVAKTIFFGTVVGVSSWICLQVLQRFIFRAQGFTAYPHQAHFLAIGLFACSIFMWFSGIIAAADLLLDRSAPRAS